MPKFADYKAAAKARGSLGLELYAVISTPAVAPSEMAVHLPDHLAYQAERERAGELFLAGPLSDLAGENIEGVGLIIYRAQDLEAARALAEADPMHMRGARSFELRRWLVNEGSLRLSVGLSTGTNALS